MALPEQFDDLLLRGREIMRARNLHIDIAQGGSSAQHSLHCAGVRHDDDIVLVGALSAQSFWNEDPCDLERNVLHSQDLSDDFVASENLGRCRSSNDTDLVRASNVLIREWCAIG